MATKYPDGDARDRSEMKCPSCFTTGLEEKQKITKFYDSTEEQIIYGSKCPNDDCDIDQVPPEEARAQLDTGFSLSIESLTSIFRELSFRTLAAFFGLFLLTGVFMLATAGIPIDLGDTGAATASESPYSNLSTADDQQNASFEVYQETDNWTIYTYSNSYIVAGQINGTVTYLEPQGETSTGPYYFSNITAARNAILAWGSKHQEQPNQYPSPTQPNNTADQTTPWQIFEHNNSYVVAGELNGSIVYLHPNGSHLETPFVYGNYSNARNAIVEWESNRLNDSELPNINPADKTEVASDLNEWDPDGGN